MKLILLAALVLSLVSCSRKPFIQTVEVSYSAHGMKITPVDERKEVNSTTVPSGTKMTIMYH